MPRERFLVDDIYVDQTVAFVERCASFFAAALLDEGFQNWARQAHQQVRDMQQVDAVLRHILELTYDVLEQEDFQILLNLFEEQTKSLCVENLQMEYDCIIQHQASANSSLFKEFAQAILKEFAPNGELGVFYGNNMMLQCLLSDEPQLVSGLLSLEASPVFARAYNSWVESPEYPRFMRQFSNPEKADVKLLNYLLKQANDFYYGPNRRTKSSSVIARNSVPLNDKASQLTPKLTRETMNQQSLFGNGSNHKPFASSTSSKEPPFDPTDTAGCDDQQTTSPQDRSKENRAGSSSDPTNS